MIQRALGMDFASPLDYGLTGLCAIDPGRFGAKPAKRLNADWHLVVPQP
jgi:hypothetical protein